MRPVIVLAGHSAYCRDVQLPYSCCLVPVRSQPSPRHWRLAWLWVLRKTVRVDSQGLARWPEHLPAGALRVVRWSGHYDQTVIFYRDTIGLPVLETFHDSYGLDGTILGLPGSPVHLEIVRMAETPSPASGLDQLVFYLPDAAAQEHVMARLAAAGVHPVPQIDYWQANGGVTYQDPDGREVVFAAWVYQPPG
jgi:catechol 2,3-dioxygenase-like lactoylglutathione lyase family enzyme